MAGGFKSGLSANTKVQPGNSVGPGQLSQLMSKIKGSIQVGRVTDIILNKDYLDQFYTYC